MRCIITKFINFILEGTIIMATIEEANSKADAAAAAIALFNTTLAEVGTKLDEIRAFIAGLAGQPVTQEQLDALVEKLGGLQQGAEQGQAAAQAVLAETDALDEPAV